MHETRRSIFYVLTCVISLALFTKAGNTKHLQTHQDERVNRTQERSPVSEFRTHMLRAISMLSVSRQCSILTALLEDSGETLSHMIKEYKDTELYRQLPCFTKPSGSAVNTTGLRRAIDFYISRLFNTLPLAFQCKIISDVTSGSRREVTRQVLPEARAKTLSKLNVELNLVDMTKKCADTKPRGTITNTRVQLGVRLRKTMPLKVWLERFKKILPTLYLSYVSKSGRISEFVTVWRMNENGAKVPVIPIDQFLVRYLDDPIVNGAVAMITFSLYSRSPSGDYKLINGDEVAASFDDINQSTLNSYVQAEVIGWRSHGERDNVRIERMRKRKDRLTSLEIFRLQASFPKYLLKFFKSMSSDGRCYVLRQISSYVGRDLQLVEKRYHSLGILPKKYFCSQTWRFDSKSKTKRPKPRLASIWGQIDEFIQKISKPTTSLALTTTVLPARNSTVIRETRPFNSMEIVMFVLLGFLCLLIMVFIANCIVFTFKTKQLNSKYATSDLQSTQFVLRDGETQNCGNGTVEIPPGKLCLTENPQPRFNERLQYKLRDKSECDREPSVFFGTPSERKSSRNHNWRLLSMTSDGGVTVCDVISLSEDEPERISSV